jgi:hypothetical protein
VTVAVWVMAVPLIVADTVFASATVERSVPVATPLPLVVALGCVSVFPLPVAASTTVFPLIAFPAASLAVTVIVAVPVPTRIEPGAAVTVDCKADTEPTVTFTVTVGVSNTPFAVAERVFDSATVALKVPMATPLLFVGPGCVKLFPLPVADSTTVAPLIACPPPSFTVTVIVALPLPAVIDVADVCTVDLEGETAADVTVTVARWVIAVPLAVADTVFPSATVELSVPVATPLAFVGPGCVRGFPLPEAASTTVAPLMALPLASFTVTVIVAVLGPAGIDEGTAVTVDSAGDTRASVTVTVAV